MTNKTITRNNGGTAEHTVEVSAITIPDLWHIAMRLDKSDREAVLECWHIAHDLKQHLESK